MRKLYIAAVWGGWTLVPKVLREALSLADPPSGQELAKMDALYSYEHPFDRHTVRQQEEISETKYGEGEHP